MDQSPYTEDFNTIKVIVLFEVEPLSDHFHQIVFTEEQILKIQKFISKEILGEDEKNGFTIMDAPGVCLKLPNSRSWFSQREIDLST